MEIGAGQKIIFDPENNYKIRVIEPEQFKETKNLKEGCDVFSNEVNEFMSSVKEFLEYMDAQSRRVEDQKLRSIALRNRVQDEIDSRKRAANDLQSILDSKQKELERINAEIRSYEELERQLNENTEKLNMI